MDLNHRPVFIGTLLLHLSYFSMKRASPPTLWRIYRFVTGHYLFIAETLPNLLELQDQLLWFRMEKARVTFVDTPATSLDAFAKAFRIRS